MINRETKLEIRIAELGIFLRKYQIRNRPFQNDFVPHMLRFVDGWTELDSQVIKDPKLILLKNLAAFAFTIKDRYHCQCKLLLLAVAQALDK